MLYILSTLAYETFSTLARSNAREQILVTVSGIVNDVSSQPKNATLLMLVTENVLPAVTVSGITKSPE